MECQAHLWPSLEPRNKPIPARIPRRPFAVMIPFHILSCNQSITPRLHPVWASNPCPNLIGHRAVAILFWGQRLFWIKLGDVKYNVRLGIVTHMLTNAPRAISLDR